MLPEIMTLPQRIQKLLGNILSAFAIIRQYPIIIPLAIITLIGEMNYSGINNVALPKYIGVLNLPQTVGNTNLLARFLGTDGGVVGFIASIFLFSEMLSRMPAGWLSDRLGRPKLIIGALFLSAPSFLASSMVGHHYLWLIPLRFWDGIMAAAIWTSMYAIIGDAVPERLRANAMGVINMMYMMGVFFGVGIALIINNSVPKTPQLFLAVSAMLVLVTALLSMTFFRRNPQLNHPHPEVHLEEAEKAIVSVSRHTVLLFITFFQNFALTLVAPFMIRYATDPVSKGGLDLQPTSLALLIGLPIVGVGIFAVPLSRVADKIGKLSAVRIAFTVAAGTLWIFTYTHHLWVLSIIATVVGIAFSMGVPAWLAILSSLTGRKTRGTTLGGYGAIQGLAAVIGPVISGTFIWGRYGHASIFLASSISLAIAALLTWFALPEQQKKSVTAQQREAK